MGKILWSNRKPTAAELEALRRDAEAAEQEARDQAVRQALATEADPLFFKWQRGEVVEADWLAKVAEVKGRFPTK
ncbi:MAG: hypothetical protein MUE52_18895 [Tabrizicola sp.]|jgi:hypothetical protein|nr:hypothetical protein [Tabrizicola sp.]